MQIEITLPAINVMRHRVKCMTGKFDFTHRPLDDNNAIQLNIHK